MNESSHSEPVKGAIPAWDKWLFRLCIAVLTIHIGLVLVILIRALNFWLLHGELPVPMEDDPKDLHTLVDILGRWYTDYFSYGAYFLTIPALLVCVIQLFRKKWRWAWPICTFVVGLALVDIFFTMDPWNMASWFVD